LAANVKPRNVKPRHATKHTVRKKGMTTAIKDWIPPFTNIS